jgi:Curlin associated repeat
MSKTLATLMIGISLFAAAPAFAGNEADIVQEGGGENYIEAEQRGRDNDFASSQDGTVNTLALKQRGRDNKAQAHQNGDDNAVFLDQKSRRPKK